ncbi:MAG: 3-phosphoshikimate 1-carboxyvinyltransferase [Candidatus Omnitrophota bacterium]
MYTIRPLVGVKKAIVVPADKSISHRAVMLASLAKGMTRIEPILLGDDIMATIDCMKRLGVSVSFDGASVSVAGSGLFFPKTEKITLYAHESGTTMRILSGILCGQKFPVSFDAAIALRKRPMSRVTVPLRAMAADITGHPQGNEEYPPLSVRPVKKMKGITYALPVASAQVKSAILCASLYAKGTTVVRESIVSRDHTERMLKFFGARIRRQGRTVFCQPSALRPPQEPLFIPSDFSSAAFFIVLGAITKKSEITMRMVNTNPTRCGLLKVLRRMGAHITLRNRKEYFEPYADIISKSSALSGVEVNEKEIPLLVDDIPVLCVAASFAKGKTVIRGVKELKVKETDRIHSMVYNLRQAGVDIKTASYIKDGQSDWLIEINGTGNFRGSDFKSFSDHRTAMSSVILGLASGGVSTLDDIHCINKSFPQFISLVESLY